MQRVKDTAGEADFAPAPRTREMVTNNGTRLVSQNKSITKSRLIFPGERTRYGAVVPQRTATQRRVYSDADVHRLKLLRQTTLLGHPIGSIANLPDEALEALIKAAAARAPSQKIAGKGEPIFAYYDPPCQS